MIDATLAAAPLVSVIVRTTHRATLAEALASVDAQTYPNLEIVVVDALGTGITLPSSGQGERPRRTISTGTTLSYSPAANAGLDSARGEYLIFLDDDDFFDVTHIASLWHLIRRKPGARVAYAATRKWDARGSVIGTVDSEFSPYRLHQTNLMTICAVLFSRTLLDCGCRFDTKLDFVEDWDFWLQVSCHTAFLATREVTTNWRCESGESGAGQGANYSQARRDAGHAALAKKWTPTLGQLVIDFERHSARTMELSKAGDFSQAISEANRALAIDPLDAAMLNLLAMLLMKVHQPYDATAALQTAMRNKPDQHWLWLNYARLCERMGRPDEARLSIAHVLEREPHNDLARQAQASLLPRPAPSGVHRGS